MSPSSPFLLLSLAVSAMAFNPHPRRDISTQTLTATALPTAQSTYDPFHRSPEQLYIEKMCQRTIHLPAPPLQDLQFPCQRISNISFTCLVNATALRSSAESGSPEIPYFPAEEQQKCICPGGFGESYWEDLRGCGDCIRLHGAPLNDSTFGLPQWAPAEYISAESSAFCAMPTATRNLKLFDGNFSATHGLTYGTETPGSDQLQSQTAISLYFTETPVKAQATGSTGSVKAGVTASTTPAQTQASSAGSPAPTKSTSSAGSPAPTQSTSSAARISGASVLLGIALFGVVWMS